MENKIYGRTPDYGWKSRFMYGVGEFFGGGCFLIINSFFAVFLTKALGLPTALSGTIILIGMIWDAITDPIMGNLTDRTRSRFGPKRFYILVGSIFASLTFVLMWVRIPMHSNVGLFVIYMFLYCLFSTGFTVLTVPYNGLLPDMIDDYAQRARFSNVRMIWSTIGAMVCGVVPTIMIRDNTNPATYLHCALLFGVLFFISSILVFFGTWEKHREPVQVTLKESFPQSASVFKSRSFRLFIGIYLFGQCGIDFISGMAVYYVDDVLNGYANGYFTYMMGVLMISQLIGMFVFGPIMSRSSKRKAILIGAPIRLAGILGILAFSYEGVPLMPILCMAALIGFGNAASLTGIFAIMSDMADVDELITSTRRPGVVSGMATFARKISSGVSASVIGFLLAAVGYDEVLANAGVRQSAFTQRGIAWIFVLAPAILTILLIVVTVLFPMSAEEFRMVQEDVERRKGERTDEATEEEKQILKRVTGFAYEDLWKKEHAGLGRQSAR